MSGIATAVVASAVIAGGVAIYASSKSSQAAGISSDAYERVAGLNARAAEAAARAKAAGTVEAAEIAAAAQREATAADMAYKQQGLDYLIQSEKLPLKYRDDALGVLGELYGTGPGEDSTAESFLGSPLAQRLDINQGDLVETAMNSPMYAAFMGTQQAGEESIMRHAAATGGLRSGNVQENLYDYNVQLGKESLSQAYNLTLGEELNEQSNILRMVSGLEGLARYEGNAPAVASQYSAMGQTAGSGLSTAGMIEAGGVSGAADAYSQGILGVANSQSSGILGSAQAQAGGILGSADAWQQGAQNIGNTALSGLGMYYMMNPQQQTQQQYQYGTPTQMSSQYNGAW